MFLVMSRSDVNFGFLTIHFLITQYYLHARKAGSLERILSTTVHAGKQSLIY